MTAAAGGNDVSNPNDPRPENTPETAGATDAAEDERPAIQQMIRRAQAGDEAVVPALREFLRRRGAADAFGGNLAWSAMSALVRAHAGSDLLVREAIFGKLDLLYLRLCSESEKPTAVEELLIERVVSTWLHLHSLEEQYASTPDPMIIQMSCYQRAISAAQFRYLSAIKELAEIRKQPLPPVQINVANEQVNVAGNVVNDRVGCVEVPGGNR